jgi:hypothetical protein
MITLTIHGEDIEVEALLRYLQSLGTSPEDQEYLLRRTLRWLKIQMDDLDRLSSELFLGDTPPAASEQPHTGAQPQSDEHSRSSKSSISS